MERYETVDQMTQRLDELHEEWSECMAAGDEMGKLVVEDDMADLNAKIEIALGGNNG